MGSFLSKPCGGGESPPKKIRTRTYSGSSLHKKPTLFKSFSRRNDKTVMKSATLQPHRTADVLQASNDADTKPIKARSTDQLKPSPVEPVPQPSEKAQDEVIQVSTSLTQQAVPNSTVSIKKDKEHLEPEVGKEEHLEPEVGKEEHLEPEVSKEEHLEPEVSKEEHLEPEVGKEEHLEPEVGKEEHLEPEVGKEEHLEPEVGKEEHLEPEVGKEEHLEPEVSKEEHLEPNVCMEEQLEPEKPETGAVVCEEGGQTAVEDMDKLEATKNLLDVFNEPLTGTTELNEQQLLSGDQPSGDAQEITEKANEPTVLLEEDNLVVEGTIDESSGVQPVLGDVEEVNADVDEPQSKVEPESSHLEPQVTEVLANDAVDNSEPTEPASADECDLPEKVTHDHPSDAVETEEGELSDTFHDGVVEVSTSLIQEAISKATDSILEAEGELEPESEVEVKESEKMEPEAEPVDAHGEEGHRILEDAEKLEANENSLDGFNEPLAESTEVNEHQCRSDKQSVDMGTAADEITEKTNEPTVNLEEDNLVDVEEVKADVEPESGHPECEVAEALVKDSETASPIECDLLEKVSPEHPYEAVEANEGEPYPQASEDLSNCPKALQPQTSSNGEAVQPHWNGGANDGNDGVIEGTDDNAAQQFARNGHDNVPHGDDGQFDGKDYPENYPKCTTILNAANVEIGQRDNEDDEAITGQVQSTH